MKMNLREILNNIKKYVFEKSRLNLIDNLKIYSPNSAGDYKSKAKLTLICANEIIPTLNSLCSNLKFENYLEIVNIQDYNNLKNSMKIGELEKLLNKYGSDKANRHNYHIFYSTLFENTNEVKNILEVGLGTNNKNIVSTMGKHGNPGASLKAFRDYFSNANIYGADIDKSILFNDIRIKTFYFNQLDTYSHENINFDFKFDLIIDDGLHMPIANIRTINFALSKITDTGYLVIEDILDESLPIFNLISFLLKESVSCKIINTNYGNLFVINKKSL